MILYTSAALANPSQVNNTAPSTARGMAIQNVSAWTFKFMTDTDSFIILPMANASVPLNGGQYWSMTPVDEISMLTLSIPLEVSASYLTVPVASFSQSSPLPAFSGNVTITNSTLDVNATIQGGTVNVGTVSGTVTVGGSVDANITNATLDIGTISGTVTISGDVGITAGQLVQVKNESGGSLTVAGTVNATITNSTLDVNATIQNATLNVATASGTTLTVGGSVDANITNATLDIGTISGTVTISGDVGITAGQLVQVKNESGGSLTVAGALDANITNATIETNSTVLNSVDNAVNTDAIPNAATYFSIGPEPTSTSGTQSLAYNLNPSGGTLVSVTFLPSAWYGGSNPIYNGNEYLDQGVTLENGGSPVQNLYYTGDTGFTIEFDNIPNDGLNVVFNWDFNTTTTAANTPAFTGYVVTK